MFIIYELATCALVVMAGGMVLFLAAAMCVILAWAGEIAWRKWPELSQGADWVMGRWTAAFRTA